MDVFTNVIHIFNSHLFLRQGFIKALASLVLVEFSCLCFLNILLIFFLFYKYIGANIAEALPPSSLVFSHQAS